MLTNSQWIWIDKDETKDEYVAFWGAFDVSEKDIFLTICTETNYIAYVNNQLASFGQFPSSPTEKYYDKIDVSAWCKKGKTN